MLDNVNEVIAGNYSGMSIELTLIFICWGMMIVAVFIDLWTGVERAKACGEKMKSGKFRLTLIKIGDYWRVMIFGLFIDIILFMILDNYAPFGSLLFAIACCFIEGKSVIENLRRKRSAAADVPQAVIDIIKSIDNPEKLSAYIEILNKLNKKHEDNEP